LIVDRWVEEIGLDPAGYGTHSIRRTKPTLIYRGTRNLRAVQLLLGPLRAQFHAPWTAGMVHDCPGRRFFASL